MEKKPIIVIADDVLSGEVCTRRVKSLATALGYDGEQIAQHIKVFGHPDDLYEALNKSEDKMILACVDNGYEEEFTQRPSVYAGVDISNFIHARDPDAKQLWISNREYDDSDQQHMTCKQVQQSRFRQSRVKDAFCSLMPWNTKLFDDTYTAQKDEWSEQLVIRNLKEAFEQIAQYHQHQHATDGTPDPITNPKAIEKFSPENGLMQG